MLLGLVPDALVPKAIVEVEDIGTTAKTLPDFPQLWADMLQGQAD
jgi:hypothetical protein